MQQVLDARWVQPAALSQRVALVPQGGVALGTQHRHVLGHRRRDLRVQGPHCFVDGVPGHEPVGRVLPARDHDQPGYRVGHGVLARQQTGLVALAGQQRPQPGVDTFHVLDPERLCEHAVRLLQQVVHVASTDRRMALVQVPVGVGRPDDPVPTPGDDEQHAGGRAQDQSRRALDAIPRDDQVHALRRPDPELPPRVGQGLGVVGPHPGRVDHLPGPHRRLPTRLEVAHHGPGDPLPLPQQAHYPRAVGAVRPVRRGRACQQHRVPRVVDLGVPVLHRAHEGVGSQRRRLLQGAPPGQVPMTWQPAALARPQAHHVVQGDPRAHVRALPPAVLQRVEKRHRPHQVRRQALQQQRPLPEGLCDQPEVEHLQVAQPAVYELAATTAGAAGPVTSLHQTRPQPPRDRVERRPAPHDPATDHQDVELGAGEQLLERRLTGRRRQPLCHDHAAPAGALARGAT